MPWGERGWMCPWCRSALPPAVTCCPDSAAVDLGDPAARARHAHRVWRSESRSIRRAISRGRLLRAARLTWRKLRAIVAAPRGASDRWLRPPRRPALHGVARGDEPVPPPGGEPCLAYGVELRCHRFRGGPVMLRDAGSAGFTVTLDDGRELRIPAGPVHLVMDGAPVEALGRARTDALRAFTGAVAATDARPLFPYDEIVVRRIRAGDPVRLWADLVDDVVLDYRGAATLVARPPIWVAPAGVRGA